MRNVIGVGLAAGQGVRFRPLTLKAKGYLRAKAAVRLLGRRVLDWLIDTLQYQGLDDFILVTRGKENRYQIKSIVGYGERLNVRIRYSPVRYDSDNTGSADALLTNLDYFEVRDTAFVFPTDSLLDLDLEAMLDAHQRTGAVVTIAAAPQPADIIAHRYGVMELDGQGRVSGFCEKPSLEEIFTRFGVTGAASPQLPPLMTNAGFYLVDSAALREISRHPDIQRMRAERFDIGGDLLPWLVAHDYPVHTFQIGRMGDLGNISSYLETMLDVLHGKFASMKILVSRFYPCVGCMQVDQESLEMRDPITNLTLAEKIDQGLVDIRPPVRIGKYVRIYPGVILSECNIDDDCEIYENATITRSSIGAGSLIGPHSYIEDTLTGIMVELQSEKDRPVVLKKDVAIGDEVIVRSGVCLFDSVTIHPRLKIPAGARIPAATDIESADQMLEYL